MEHDHPVFAIPAGVKRDAVHWKVCVWDLLAGMLIAIAVFINHHRTAQHY